MASVQALVPPEHAGEHVLVVPATSSPSVPQLATAWFADVAWLRAPVVPVATPVAGARFRGLRAAPTPSTGPGVLRLGDEHRAAGPYELDAATAALAGLPGPSEAWALARSDGMLDQRGARPTSFDDRDGLARAFAAGLPTAEELDVVRWGVAVARRQGGVLVADGRQQLRPDPTSGVDLAVWTTRPLTSADLLATVRSVVATAQPAATDDRLVDRVVVRTPYDGDLVVDARRATGVPRVVGPAAPGTTHFTYRLWWSPQDPYELQVEQPSGLHVIARGRVRALLARVAGLLQSRVEGAVVDDGGFLVSAGELQGRLGVASSGARAWV